MTDASASAPDSENAESSKEVAGGELQPENVYRTKEMQELEELVHPDLRADVGSNVSSLYELVGMYHICFLSLQLPSNSLFSSSYYHPQGSSSRLGPLHGVCQAYRLPSRGTRI